MGIVPFLSGRAARIGALAFLFLLTACVVTTDRGYFSAGDFVQPKLMSGDWKSVPADPDDDILKVRITPHGALWRAQPLFRDGEVDTSERPVDFGLVDLGHSWYLAVQTDSKTGEGPFKYFGLKTEADRLIFYLFSGGESPGGKAKFDALVASLGMTRDQSQVSNAHLTGNIRKTKLRALFRLLLADPMNFDAHPAVFARMHLDDRPGRRTGGHHATQ